MFLFPMSTMLLAPPTTAERQAETAELRPLVRAVVASILREPPDHADVEDCTNEALRRALEPHVSLRGPVRPWLLGIARHVALDALRQRQQERARQREIPEDEGSSRTALVNLLVAPEPLVDEKLELEQRASRIRRALATLPDGPRQALEAFHLEGQSYQDIAVRLRVPLGTVATWVNRGRRALANALEDEPSSARHGGERDEPRAST